MGLMTEQAKRNEAERLAKKGPQSPDPYRPMRWAANAFFVVFGGGILLTLLVALVAIVLAVIL